MMWKRPNPTGLCLLALLSCVARDEQAPREPSVDPGTVAGQVALELWQLRDGLNLERWFADHVAEDVERLREDTLVELGRFCARAERRVSVDGRQLVRQALFYPPEPPAGLELPNDTSPQLAGGCRLGAIRVEVGTDSLRGPALADSVRVQLSSAFGAGDTTDLTAITGAAYWRRPVRFRRGASTVYLGLVERPRIGPDPGGRHVVALAFLPWASPVAVRAAGHDSVVVDTLPLVSAVAQSRLDTALWVPLRRALAATVAGPPAPVLDPDSLYRPLSRWLQASWGLSPGRRSAALFVADEVLTRSGCAYRLCDEGDPAQIRRFSTIGARFADSPSGHGFSYTRNWLSEARLGDRDSPVGRQILLIQLESGFDLSGSCREGADGWRRVIDNGERYLARVTTSPISAAVHLYAARAWGDMVALARGAAPGSADTTGYGAAEPEARLSAIDHYRAAIRDAPGTPLARAAWREAWWLLAGFAPSRARFLCTAG